MKPLQRIHNQDYSQTRSKRANGYAAVVMVTLSALTGACRQDSPDPGAPVRESAPRWNVLLITFDTTRFDRISSYGYERSRTPTVDALARRGIRYSRCYSVAPITLPSHASIMTGLYPFYHRLRDNGTGPLDDRAVTLAEVLKKEGYQTGAAIGAFVLDERFGLSQGFDHYDGEIPLPKPGEVTHHFPERDARAVTDAALSWLHRTEPPYFLWVHYFDPHQPYAAPGMPPGTSRDDAYDLEIRYADTQLGRLLDTVRAIEATTGQETLIVFAADHGEALGDHGEDTHAFFVYNETVQVPLVVVIPQSDLGGTTVDAPVSLVDIAPSILGWLEIALPYEMHGRTLPLNNQAGPNERRPLYFETHVPFNTYRWSPLEGILVGDLKYIHAPKPEFYDLTNDPRELRNTFDAQESRAQDFLDALRTLQSSPLDAPSFDPVGRFAEAETLTALRALGYVGAESAAPPIEIDEFIDPKDRVNIHVMLANLHGALEAGATDRVLDTLAHVFKTDPGNIEALRQLSQQLESPQSAASFLALGLEQAKLELPKPYDLRLPIALIGALVRDQQETRARELAASLVERHPDSAEAHNVLATTYLVAGDLSKAEQYAQASLAIDPQFPAASNTLGEIALARGRADQAIAYFEAGSKDGEYDAPTLLKIGEANAQAGRVDKAASYYEQAIDKNPKFAEPYAARAELHMNQSEWDAAIRLLRQAAEIRPDLVDVQYNLGLALNNNGAPFEAADAFQQVLRIDPDHGRALINLGIALFSSGRKERGIDELKRATQMTSVAPDAYYNLATAYAVNGENDKAADAFEQALELRPTFAEPVNQLTSYYLSMGRASNAARVLRIGVQNHADNVVFHNMLAMVLATSKDDDVRDGALALRHARRADDLTGHQHVEVLATLAAAYAEAGDFDAAQQTAQKAIERARAANRTALIEQLTQQIDLYRGGKPYRDPRF